MMYAIRLLAALSLVVLPLASGGCAADDDELDESSSEIRVTSTFTSKSSAYYPDSSTLEGGYFDMKGKPLQTLQQFLKGKAKYVSVAMDKGVFKYGQRLRIREANARYGRDIIFRVVDTGGAFYGKGRSRIDICVQTEQLSFDKLVNGKLTIDVIDETRPPVESQEPPPGTTEPPPSAEAYCRGDGDCNPGNDGSGTICVNKQCVPGCKRDNQCPGIKKCVAGMCQ
jgi:3D (Asp-Asp-Asp) domain-containing protein